MFLRFNFILLLGTFLCQSLIAQVHNAAQSHGSSSLRNEQNPCISLEDYQAMDKEILENKKRLGISEIRGKTQATTALEWPLRPSSKLKDCDYFYISAFVDLDSTSSIKDWNCGKRTYNGHRGIDIVPWPFIWDKMDRDLVEVVAAAPGIIIAKKDGNPDRICNGIGGGSNSNNYITIQHPDGSSALYIHMKSNSLTKKNIGDSVTTGEYLGIVGSAGQSTGVHLHFEIRSDGTFANYIDPFMGACNPKIGQSWWKNQILYAEPKIIKTSIHSDWPYMATCPITKDTTYEKDTFIYQQGQTATFYACSKHISKGDNWSFKILNPDNTVYDSWNFSSASDRNTITMGWTKVLPSKAGTYKFEASFKSSACSQNFTILSTLDLDLKDKKLNPFKIIPNPNNGNFILEPNGDLMSKTIPQVLIYSSEGKVVKAIYESNYGKMNYSGLSTGLYHYVAHDIRGFVYHGTFVIYE